MRSGERRAGQWVRGGARGGWGGARGGWGGARADRGGVRGGWGGARAGRGGQCVTERIAGGFDVRPHRRGRPVPVAVPHSGGDPLVIAERPVGTGRVGRGIGRPEEQAAG